MSNALANCRHIPSWMKPFLAAVKNGYNEKNAANMSGVGTNIVHQRMVNDPDFKASYDEIMLNQKPRYGHGAW